MATQSTCISMPRSLGATAAGIISSEVQSLMQQSFSSEDWCVDLIRNYRIFGDWLKSIGFDPQIPDRAPFGVINRPSYADESRSTESVEMPVEFAGVAAASLSSELQSVPHIQCDPNEPWLVQYKSNLADYRAWLESCGFPVPGIDPEAAALTDAHYAKQEVTTACVRSGKYLPGLIIDDPASLDLRVYDLCSLDPRVIAPDLQGDESEDEEEG